MSDFFDELTKDVKDEKVQRAFVKMLPKVIYFTVAIIIVMILKNWFDSRKTKHEEKLGDMLHKAIMLNENKELEIGHELLENFIKLSDNAQKDIGKLHEIRLLFDTNNVDSYQEKLKDIFSSPASKDLSRSYARLLWAVIELNKNKSNVLEEEVEKNLALSAAKGSIFYGNGSIIYSLWLIKKNRIDEARTILEEMIKNNENIPSSISSAATAILSNLPR